MAEKQNSIGEALGAVLELLEHLKKTGKGVSISPESLDLLKKGGGGPFTLAPSTQSKSETRSTPASKTAAAPVDMERPAVLETLDQVREWIGDCRRCALSDKRNKLVFGDGNPNAELMFIGEGPGRDEDLQGIPFVGAAGKLLTKMIEGGLQKQRSEVYIANIVKCRPPGNREPAPDEAAICKKFLIEQIRIIQPKVICALGRIATNHLLEMNTPISKMRGNWYSFMGIKVMPTFHPAALLRNPNQKRPTWEDLKMIMVELGWNKD